MDPDTEYIHRSDQEKGCHNILSRNETEKWPPTLNANLLEGTSFDSLCLKCSLVAKFWSKRLILIYCNCICILRMYCIYS